VDAITSRDDVQKAMDTLQNGARTRLMGMIYAAQERTAADDIFPGDAP
jgi:hypothetical protein